MDEFPFGIYQMNDEREKVLWENCIFVFDSSALLNLYFYPEESLKEIYTEIFGKLKDRLWIASHIEYEYLKNRKTVITKPIAMSYLPLRKDFLDGINRNSVTIKNKINELKEQIRKNDKHTYIEKDEVEKYDKLLDSFINETQEFQDAFNIQIDEKISSIQNLEKNDTVLDNIKEYFQVGPYYLFSDIIKITIEGKHRYEFQIPPGYMDFDSQSGNGKKGTQIFGDLIIWKQILDYSHKEGKDIVFVCDDLKEDWCCIDKERKRIISPRHELIKEFIDTTNKDFWMYDLPQFIHLSKKYLDSKIDEKPIDQISQTIVNPPIPGLPTFVLRAMNASYVSTNQLEFDIFLQHTNQGASSPFNYGSCQYCFTYNPIADDNQT